MSTFNSQGAQGGGANNPNSLSLLSQFRRHHDADPETTESVNQLSQQELSQLSSSGPNGQSLYKSNNAESSRTKLQSATHSSNGKTAEFTRTKSATDSSILPPAAPTPPVHGFGSSQYPPSMMSMNAPNAAQSGQSAELLNILKLGQQTPGPVDSAPALSNIIHAPVPVADPTGLLAALMKGHLPSKPSNAEPTPGPSWNQNSPPADTHQYLLGLLNRPKPTQNEAFKAVNSPQSLLPSSGTSDTQDHVDGGNHALGAVPTMPTQAKFHFESKNLDAFAPMYDNSASSRSGSATKLPPSGHIKPLEDSGSLRGTHKSHDTTSASRTGNILAQALPVRVLENADLAQNNKRTLGDRALSANFAGPDATRVKLDTGVSATSSRSFSASRETAGVADEPKEPAAEANTAAQNAIGRAEEQIVRATEENSTGSDVDKEITHDLEKMMNAKTSKEFDQSAQNAAKAIKRELDKAENEEALNTPNPELPETVKDIIDQTAQHSGPVADSWESADADEIVVTEETKAPVNVYNFPLKPWISITLCETDQPRALFREEAMLDIARLKKDFDQIDRNLVAASEFHLAYGMSKAGGFRVVKQEDGKDARMFTDTKDRIFNVAICTAGPDKTPREAALATGVSGTVYWVLLRNGDREHVDDAHPEQYGFALPPLMSHESDSPGGILKTRARTSASRPDYFAVGRGRSIYFIWPSFIFRHNLFMAGHDRVVDTDQLLKKSTLKINTGKAGKDFTLSLDDTIMVTLDKSGRLKFWDVRDLTAVDEASDPAKPLPAHTSREINEPMMTLTATPEGEKAWPTSVLLLDKYRPYQKSTALRYMIVGMKQNHTLQLWDLALGKVVQEFQFPHDNEWDGACSVVYHAPTSMVVVGHPARNSIYFLHLSAPKYSFKGLSQYEFIRRLGARDPSIPQPDSTAVISGIREYSLSNKGILRSLTLLESAHAQGDVDEPILFELYAMHSRGVTCLSIKQSELGWTKENHVISPVDAVQTGYVSIGSIASMSKEPEPEPPLPVQSRTNPRTPKAASSHASTVVKVLERPKDDAPAPVAPMAPMAPFTPVTPVDKRARRKRAAAAAAAAAAETGSAAGSAAGPTKPVGGNHHENSVPAFGPEPVQSAQSSLAAMEARIMNHVTNQLEKAMFGLSMNAMNLDNAQQKRDQKRDQEFTNKQTIILDMMARILTENTDVAMASIFKAEFEKTLKPHMADQYNRVANEVSDRVTKAVPGAIKLALQAPDTLKDTLKLLSDGIARELGDQMQVQTLKAVNTGLSSLLPKHLDEAVSSLLPKHLAQKHDELNHYVVEKLEQQQHHVVEKLDHQQHKLRGELGLLTEAINNMTGTIRSLASTQLMVQQELASVKQILQQQALQYPNPSYPGGQAHASRPFDGPSTGSRSARGAPVQQQQMQLHSQPFFVPSEPDRSLVKQTARQQQGPLVQQQQQGQVQQQGQSVQQPPLGTTTASQSGPSEGALAIQNINRSMRIGDFQDAAVQWVHQDPKYHDDIFMHAIMPFRLPFLAEADPLLVLTFTELLTGSLPGEFSNIIKGLTATGSALLRPKLAMIEALLNRATVQQAASLVDGPTHKTLLACISTARVRIETIYAEVHHQLPHNEHLPTLVHLFSMAVHLYQIARDAGGSQTQAIERGS